MSSDLNDYITSYERKLSQVSQPKTCKNILRLPASNRFSFSSIKAMKQACTKPASPIKSEIISQQFNTIDPSRELDGERLELAKKLVNSSSREWLPTIQTTPKKSPRVTRIDKKTASTKLINTSPYNILANSSTAKTDKLGHQNSVTNFMDYAIARNPVVSMRLNRNFISTMPTNLKTKLNHCNSQRVLQRKTKIDDLMKKEGNVQWTRIIDVKNLTQGYPTNLNNTP